MNARVLTSQLVETAGTSDSVDQLGEDDLRDLMRAVTDTTQRLQQTHVALKEEVVRLQKELAEANAQLRRSRSLAALGEMAAGIAHEVRNPLGSIQLYVQVLEEELDDRPEQAQLCRKIDRAVVGLNAIVRDVLLFAREVSITPAPTTTDELIERALTQCESLVVGNSVTIERNEDVNHEFSVDSSLMTQVLSNVIRNAIEAIQIASEGDDAHPRTLRIGTDRMTVRCPGGHQDHRIIMTVEDTGPGIPDEVIERMFNPFFTTRKTGTGLGLAIVHRIVDAHGGHVNVRNLEAGGARIELCMPEQPIANTQNEGEDTPTTTHGEQDALCPSFQEVRT